MRVRIVGSGSRLAGFAIAASLLLVGGCASVEVTARDPYQGDRLARPDRILVPDFAATVEDLPAWSEAAKEWAKAEAEAQPAPVYDAQAVAAGRQLGAQMAADLVVRIRKMGLGAERMTAEDEPTNGDLVIVGALTSVDPGSSAKRLVLGFGSGAAEISTQVEGYLATEEGFVKVGSGKAQSVKALGPGVAVPVAVTAVTANPISLLVSLPVKVAGEATGRSGVEGVGRRMVATIAEELEKRFEAQGWID